MGLVGTYLVLVAVSGIYWLKQKDWVYWLQDNPLSKKRKGQLPIHKTLEETLQKLSNAIESTGAPAPAPAPEPLAG